MRGVWRNLMAVTKDEVAKPNEETIVSFSIDKRFVSEEELDHDYHKIVGSLRRIQLGISEMDRLLNQRPEGCRPEDQEKLSSLKESARELDSYTTHWITQLSRSLGYL